MVADIHRNIPDSYGTNVYRNDPDFARLLRIYAEPELLSRVEGQFDRLGELSGSELETLALAADKNPPVLKTRSRNGAVVQEIDKHPAYLKLEQYAYGEFGLAAMSHRAGVFGEDMPLPPIIKYGLTYLFVQAEFGLCCPLSMTDALTRTLRKFGSEELVARYIDELTSQDMSANFQGAMFMTEQDAGSDVGAISTTAREDGGKWLLYGDKWFCSNPDANLVMVLARPEAGGAGTRGLNLFLLPRHREDGSLNSYRIVRLKDKLGTRSMASGEIVLEGAQAYMVGDPGEGFKQMTDMMNMSRLSNGVRSAGLMHRAVSEALFISRNRNAFGKRLIDLPLMQRQLIKMMVTAEQGRAMVFHTAAVLRHADAGDDESASLLRILTPLIKCRTTRDGRKVAGDALEVRGGCGYIEEWSDARILRDAHLGSIWEGTSNIVALDIFRSIRRESTLKVLRSYLVRLIDEAELPQASARLLQNFLDKVADRAAQVAETKAHQQDVRAVGTALYNITSAILLAWEASTIGDDWRRLTMAHCVVQHKLMPRDVLAPTEGIDPAERLLLDETPMTRDQCNLAPQDENLPPAV